MKRKNTNKILVVGPTSPPFGGLETYIETLLASELSQRFRLIHLNTRKKLRPASTKGRIDLPNIGYGILNLAKLLWKILRYRPNVLHLPITSTSSGFFRDAVFIMAARPMVPRILAHVHGGDFDLFFENASTQKKRFIVKTLDTADVIIALSGYWKNFLEGTGTATPIVVLPNGIPAGFLNAFRNRIKPDPKEKKFPPLHSRKTERKSLSKRSFSHSGTSISASSTSASLNPSDAYSPCVILFFGSIGYRKGACVLLDAAAELKKRNIRPIFHFVGEGERPGEMDRFTTHLQRLNIEDMCIVDKPQFDEKKMESFASADIFVLPTRNDAFPIAVLEAMAAGLPVVSTPVGSIPEILGEEAGGILIEPGKPIPLADALATLVTNPDLRKEMGEKNRLLAHKLYDFNRILPKLAALYSGKNPPEETE